MAVLVIAITLLFLGSVSAADDINDVNLTDYDNSLEISELNEIDDVDDVALRKRVRWAAVFPRAGYQGSFLAVP